MGTKNLKFMFVSLALLIGANARAQLQSSAWPMFHHDLRHTGQSSYLGTDTANLKWTYPGVKLEFSSFAIGIDSAIYFGGYDGKIYALNSNGTIKWSYQTSTPVYYSTPAIGRDSTVYIGSESSVFYALNSGGSVKWTYLTGGVMSSAAIGNDNTIYFGAQDGYLYALNPNGTIKWSCLTGYSIEGSSPAIGPDNTIYTGASDGALYAVSSSGTIKWSYQISSNPVISSPAIGNDTTIYIGSEDHNLYAIHPNGTVKWTYQTGSIIRSSPAIGNDGTIYIGSCDWKLYAINPNGTIKWSYPAGDPILYSSPVIGSDGMIYFGAEDGKVYAVKSDGTLGWSYPTGGDVESSPAIGSNGNIYISSADNNIYAIGPTGGPRLTSPNGGEILVRGAIDTIKWISTPDPNVKIELFKAGVLSKVIASSVANNGSYNWTIPITQDTGSNYKIKIMSTADTTKFDISNSNFSILPLSVTVTLPIGGEQWVRGTTDTVKWTNTGTSTSMKIDLYRYGFFDKNIIASTPNTGSYKWAIPINQDIDSTYQIKVTSISDTMGYDLSNNNFSISPLTVTITSPSSGQTWIRGTTDTIRWTNTGTTASVKIDLYKGGVFNSTIVKTTSNTGAYKWTIPITQAEGTNYTIKITSTSDSLGFGMSNDFHIAKLTISIISPNGGETFVRGAADTIRWTNTGVSASVKIELYRNGTLTQTLAKSAANNHLYKWAIPFSQAIDSTYRIKITSVSDTFALTMSDSVFNIKPLSIAIVSPNGGESLIRTLTYPIKWTNTGTSNSMKISLYKAGVLNNVIASAASNSGTNQGIYYWTIPNNDSLGATYRVKITSTSDTIATVMSDSSFSIIADSVPPTITLTSPDSGDKWIRGTTDTIRWTSNGSMYVNVILYKAGVVNKVLATKTLNKGFYVWSIPFTQTLGTDYRVKVECVEDTTRFSINIGTFTILPLTVTVVSPNGNEHWIRGATDTIRWINTGISKTMKIQLYKGGVFNSLISASASNTGSYKWTIPFKQALGTDYKVKVTSTSDTLGFDMSDTTFNVIPLTITLVSPNGGESWIAGHTDTIRWTNTGTTANVKIALYKSDLLNKVIIASTSNTTHSYNWAIPSSQALGTDYKIKIISVSDTMGWGMSSSNFTITSSKKGIEDAVVTVIKEYKLYSAYPNPAYKHAMICYQVPAKTKVHLNVYDLTGRLVKTLVNGEQKMGFYQANWNMTDEKGIPISKGIYFYRFETSSGYKSTKKLIVF